MADVMTFPETVNGFFEQYGIWDREEVYTNGALLISVFRVKQMLDHYFRERTCHIVEASREYVLSDGTKLYENGCSECNGYLGEDDNYCPNCGSKVVEE